MVTKATALPPTYGSYAPPTLSIYGTAFVAMVWTPQSPPAPTASLPITGYRVHLIKDGVDTGLTWDFPVGSNELEEFPLTGAGTQATGSAYSISVSLLNFMGEGPQGGPGDSVAYNVGTPGLPTNLVTTKTGVNSFRVSWDPPASVGASAITYYGFSVYNAAGRRLNDGSTAAVPTYMDLYNMEVGTTYTVVLSAANDQGMGERAGPSAPLSFGTPPSEPRNMRVVKLPVAGSFEVHFDLPEVWGGDLSAPVKYYAMGTQDGHTTDGFLEFLSSPITLTGYLVDVPLFVSLYAQNSLGDSQTVVSANFTLRTPTAPAAPTLNEVLVGGEVMSIAFTPGDPGTETVLYYKAYGATAIPDSTQQTPALGFSMISPIVLGDLLPDTPYVLHVEAVTENFTGAASAAIAETTLPAGDTSVKPVPVTAIGKRTAFRISFNAAVPGQEYNAGRVFNLLCQYIADAGFITKLHQDKRFNGTPAAGSRMLDFKPSWNRPYEGTTPRYALGLSASGALTFYAYAGEDVDHVLVFEGDTLYCDDDTVYANPSQNYEFYFCADGAEGEFFLTSLSGTNWWSHSFGTCMDVPLAQMGNMTTAPYYGILNGSGWMDFPWETQWRSIWADPFDPTDLIKSSDGYADVAATLGGWAPEVGLNNVGNSFPKAWSDVTPIQDADRALPWVVTKIPRVFLATQDGWGDWEVVGQFIVTPAQVGASGRPQGVRWVIPCPIEGYVIEPAVAL